MYMMQSFTAKYDFVAWMNHVDTPRTFFINATHWPDSRQKGGCINELQMKNNNKH
ncbi:hypothetical protein An02g09820 [Aspergillus niger]|uniref:Uncharacterized protein n=2 Tax=Aspergillus niger TaxID=5061 RepID=A2QE89_ASPNC|nr:hypothetical protein An02g09820 [Aspergillus niger]CAK37850.1 hypothetical protein An02g09820 [Aspergillus niger]